MKSRRAKMLGRIHIEFAKLCPGLSTEETRERRLDFCTQVLTLRTPLLSMRRLTEAQLGRVIEAIRDQKKQPGLPGVNVHQIRDRASVSQARKTGCGPTQMRPPMPEPPAEIIHLAGPEQVWAINKLFDYLHWTQAGREQFLKNKYKRPAPALLTPKQANSCMYILFRIAASQDLKQKRGYAKVPRQAIRDYIPELKTKLGISQKEQANASGN